MKGPGDMSHDADDGFDHEDRSLSRDRVEIASLRADDLNSLVRIDRKLTGRDRRDYMARKLEEALLDSGIRVSLAARVDDLVVGYVMARIDFGDTGRTQATAVIDTIGVNPDFAGRGIGQALISQLLANLRVLRVEQVETTLAAGEIALLGFLTRCGFRPAERIALRKRVG